MDVIIIMATGLFIFFLIVAFIAFNQLRLAERNIFMREIIDDNHIVYSITQRENYADAPENKYHLENSYECILKNEDDNQQHSKVIVAKPNVSIQRIDKTLNFEMDYA